MPDREINTGDLYNINPDDLEKGFLEVTKVFFTTAGLTARAYGEYLTAKNELKRVSAEVFLIAKKPDEKGKAPSDAVAKERVEVDKEVTDQKALLVAKTLDYEKLKAAKETILTKKEMLTAIGYNRKLELDVTKQRGE